MAKLHRLREYACMLHYYVQASIFLTHNISNYLTTFQDVENNDLNNDMIK